jgi:hypothetical protein
VDSKMTIQKSKEERSVKIKLTTETYGEYGKAIAEATHEMGVVELETAQAKEEIKKRTKEAHDKFSNLIAIIQAGEEEKVVTCDVEKDYGTETVRYFFKKELVEERPMTDEDRQGRLFDKEPKKTKKKSNDVADVIKEETSKKTKRDASTSASVQ